MKLSTKNIFAVIVFASTFLSLQAYAQADSGSVPPLRGTPRLLPLSMQERETPVTNNITNNQITQVVQPNTFQVSGTGAGQTTATAQADCGGGTLLGGGGTCSDGQGLVAVAGSSPVGNSWVIGCQSLNYKPVFATANAICSSN